MTKSDDRAGGVRFVYHEYDYRPGAPGYDDTKSTYQLIGVLKTRWTVWNLKWRREIFVVMLYLDDGNRWILPHSVIKKLGLNWLELLVERSSTAGGFAEAAGTELCKGNVEEIADVELDCTGTYPLAMWNDYRLSLAV